MPLFTIRRLLLLLLVIGLAVVAWCYRNATARPVIREASVMLPRWPAGQPPIRLLLLSDVHVAAPDMTPSRLAEIVWQIEAASPDIVLIAGDLVSDRRIATGHYSLRQAVAPFERLRPRLGVFAVLGNHDHWRDASEAAEVLEAVGVRLLDNEAVRAGPLAIGGLDDAFTGHDDLQATLEAMSRAGGARVLLSHSPDPFAELPSGTGLMLAGHTHCGQIRLPLYGTISTMSEHGERYACGRVDEKDNSLIVTAGVGTSIMPLRLGAPPDMWLITVGPEGR